MVLLAGRETNANRLSLRKEYNLFSVDTRDINYALVSQSMFQLYYNDITFLEIKYTAAIEFIKNVY